MSYTSKPQTCIPNPSQTHRRTENILAILPIARILFLITSLRAAAALAERNQETNLYFMNNILKQNILHNKILKRNNGSLHITYV